jgi:predicted N-acetyltransferase YhbS
MMVAATRHARQGLGARLMRCALEQAGDAIVYLTATSDGRPLYERLGFAAIDSSVSYRGRLAASAPRSGRRGAAAARHGPGSARDSGR